MAAPPLPTAEAFGALATMLVGKRVKATRGTALVTANVKSVATYVDAAGAPVFVAVTDVAFLAGIGAALAMIPLAVVNEAIKSGKPSPALVENAYEVLNIAASLFNEVEKTTAYVKVKKLDVGPASADVAKRLVKPASRLDLDVEIPGFPVGKIGLVALA